VWVVVVLGWGAIGRISLETPESRIALLASYKPPPSLGEAAQDDEVSMDDDSD
jgi:ribosome biogenesis GTPase A